MSDSQSTSDFLGGNRPGGKSTGRFFQEGSTVDGYRILSTLGEGGFGIVYLAESELPLRRRVALKVIKPGMDSKQVIARFEAERQALAVMDHPNVAKVFDAGMTESGQSYFAMEHVKGVPLTDHCDRHKLGIEQRLKLFIDVCEGVQHAHQKSIIHRDLKPSNILVAIDGNLTLPKVIDFGVAKAVATPLTEKTLYTMEGQIIGTPEYMSPEQAEMTGQDIDTRTDVYSLGVVLYQLLTGCLPFSAEYLRTGGPGHMARVIREEAPKSPSTKITTLDGDNVKLVTDARQIELTDLKKSLRGDLDWIVLKAMEKDRQRRYETAHGLSMDVQRYLDHEPILARPPSTAYRLSKLVQRNRVAFVAAATVLASLVLGLAAATWGLVEANRQRGFALTDRDVARTAKEQALHLATEKTDLAERNAQLAVNERSAREDAERQLTLATVTRLAAQSEATREEAPIKSVLLALEAVEHTRRNGQPVLPVAYETLLKATSGVGGLPLGRPESGKITYGRFTQDGRWLIACTQNGPLLLWNLTAGDPTSVAPLVLQGHQAGVVTSFGGTPDAMRISSDGRWLVTGDSLGNAILWDLTAEDIQASRVEFKGHQRTIKAVSISPDTHWLATGSDDRTARIWDLTATPKDSFVTELKGHRGSVSSVSFSPDGRWFATCGIDGTARLWDLASRPLDSATPIELTGHNEPAYGSFSPDGRWYITASVDKTARLWRMTERGPLDSPIVLQGASVIDWRAVSHDSRWLVTGGSTPHLWDLTAVDPSATALLLTGHKNNAWELSFSQSSRWLATAGWDKTARIWDLTAKHPELEPLVLRSHDGKVDLAQISPDERWLMTASDDGNARLWDFNAGSLSESARVLRGHSDIVDSTATTSDGRWLITSSRDGTSRVWDLRARTPSSSSRVLSDTGRGFLGSVALSRDDRWFVSGTSGTAARVWDLRDKDITFRELAGHSDRVTAIAISADGRRVVTGSADRTARVWDLSNDSRLPTAAELRGHENGVLYVGISPDGRWVMTSTGIRYLNKMLRADKHLRLWDLAADSPEDSGRLLENDRPVSTLKMSPDGRYAVTGHNDGAVSMWDLTTKDPASSPPVVLQGQKGAIRDLAFGPRNRYLAAGSGANTSYIWELSLEDVPSSSPAVLPVGGSVAFSADGRWLISGSGGDNTPVLWDLTAKEVTSSSIALRGHNGNVESVAMSSDGRWVITGSNDHTARLWPLNLESLIAEAQAVAGRGLTAKERQQYTLGDPPSP